MKLFEKSEAPIVLLEADYPHVKEFFDSALSEEGYFEYELSYVSEDETTFREIDRFIWESKHFTHFQNRYTGPLVIGLTAWNNRPMNNKYFDTFMYFLLDLHRQNDLYFYLEEEMCNELYNRMNRFFDVRIIKRKLTRDINENKKIGFIQEREDY